jgi:hypothetical protein
MRENVSNSYRRIIHLALKALVKGFLRVTLLYEMPEGSCNGVFKLKMHVFGFGGCISG